MPDEQLIEPDPPLDIEDIDLYCLHCDYNLRGLSGDPRRCPECGNLNPIGDLQVPAPFITAQLRRMETAPAVCLSAVLFACLCLTGTIVLIMRDINSVSVRMMTWAVLLLVISAAVWIAGCYRFRASCLGKPGWKRALRKYHAYGLLICIIICTFLPLVFLIETWVEDGVRTGNRDRDEQIQMILVVVAFATGLVLTVVAAMWGYRRAREDLKPLQREVAVTLARERLRRTLRTRHREGIFSSRKPRL